MERQSRIGRFATLTLAILAFLIAGAGVAAPVAAASADAPAHSYATSVQDSDESETVNVTATYRPAPDNDDLLLDVTIHNPEPAERDGVWFGVTTQHPHQDVEDLGDFEQYDGTRWEPKSGVDEASMTIRVNESDAAQEPTYDGYAVLRYPSTELNLWKQTFVDGDVEFSVERDTSGPVFRSEHHNLVFVGEHQNHTVTTANGPVTLVDPESVSLSSEPAAILEGFEAVAARHDAGEQYDRMLAYTAVPNDGASGRASGTTFWSLRESTVEFAGSTWIHEFMHMTDGVEPAESFEWYTEAYADYYAAYYPFAIDSSNAETEVFDHASFTGYRSELEQGTSYDANLTDPETWGENTSNDKADYNQGALTIGAIDYEIRNATADATFHDVVERLEDRESEVTHNDFLADVEAVANAEVANQSDRWLTGEEFPEPWTAEEHAAVFPQDPTPDGPTANLTIPEQEVDPGEEVGATAFYSEQGDASYDEFRWDWGDGTVETDGPNNKHVYDEPGTYEVTLTIVDENGLSDTDNATVTVFGEELQVEIEDAPDELEPSDGFRTEANVTAGDGAIESYHWELGDGTTDDGFYTAHSYDELGEFTISVTVTDEYGQTATDTHDVVVDAEPPGVDIAGPSDVQVGEEELWSAVEYERDGEVVGVDWTLGDGTTASGSDVRHAYDESGQYEMAVTVTDEYGQTATDEQVVNVTGDDGLSEDRLVVDDYEDATAWEDGRNSLGYWTGADDFESVDVADGSLSLSYDDGGWFVTKVEEDVSEYSEIAIVLRGASGGEGQDLELTVDGVGGPLAEVSGDEVTTNYQTVTVDFDAVDLDESSPGEIRIEAPWGADPSTVEIEEISLQ